MMIKVMHNTDSLVKVENLYLYLQNKPILKDINLTIHERDFITIIGPNGAGKTMLLKCIMGFIRHYKGVIHKKSSLKIGYVPQRINPDASIPITVHDFILLQKKADKHHLSKVVEQLHIGDMLTKQLRYLSGGQMQQVLLARALLQQPQLLILDEPAQNLDISGQLAFYNLCKIIYEQQPLSILMVSHDLHMVMAATKQVICLFHHICCSGTPQIVTKDPHFQNLFGQDMAKMMAIYQHDHDHKH